MLNFYFAYLSRRHRTIHRNTTHTYGMCVCVRACVRACLCRCEYVRLGVVWVFYNKESVSKAVSIQT